MKTSDNGKFIFLAGIVSYGNTNCGKAGFPGVYTKVAGYMDWINSNLHA
jgi:secreted trypsin-like serine protease